MGRIVELARSPQEKLRSRLLGPVRGLLPDQRIRGWLRDNGVQGRSRRLDAVTTVYACVLMRLGLSRSARQVEDALAQAEPGAARARRDGSAFCQARQRLPVRVLQHAVAWVGAQATQAGGEMLAGLRVVLLDGTSSALENRACLSAAFGRAKNQHGVSRLPVLRWVGLFCAGSGAVLDLACGPYACSELHLFYLLIRRLPEGRLVVADSLFCSYVHIALLRARGVHFLGRRQGTRKDARVKRLGRNDELHGWQRPRAAHTTRPALLPELPEELWVRVLRFQVRSKGYRTRTLVLCTTLLDPQKFPAASLAAWYAKRWNVELDLRALKGAHGLDRIAARKPGTVVRELYSAVLAYNLVRAVAAKSGKPVRELSHTRVQVLVVAESQRMAAVPVMYLPEMYRALLVLIGQAVLHPQERPAEPRALVRDPRRGYQILKQGRAAWKRNNRVA